MIDIQQNDREYSISLSIPFKELSFNDTPSTKDFETFCEDVFDAYTELIIKALKDRMNACIQNLIKHINSIKVVNELYITYKRKSGSYHTFSIEAYDTMKVLTKKVKQCKLSDLSKQELSQISKALYWVDNKEDIKGLTFQDLIDVINFYLVNK